MAKAPIIISKDNLIAMTLALLDAMDENGYDTYCGSGELDLESVGIASSGSLLKSLEIAIKTIGVTVE